MSGSRRARAASACAALILTLTACGGGPASAPLATSPGLSASPASISPSSTMPAQVLVSGIRGTATVTVTDPQFVDVSPPIANGTSIAFTVTAVAGGSTTITVSDASGAAVSIPVSSLACLPPVPNITFIGQAVAPATPPPAAGAPISPATFSTLFFSSADSPPANATVPAFHVRLIGSDLSIVQGSPLQPISQVAAATGAIAPPVPSGSVEWFSALPGLPGGVTYRVQLVRRGCEPPFIVGSFST